MTRPTSFHLNSLTSINANRLFVTNYIPRTTSHKHTLTAILSSIKYPIDSAGIVVLHLSATLPLVISTVPFFYPIITTFIPSRVFVSMAGNDVGEQSAGKNLDSSLRSAQENDLHISSHMLSAIRLRLRNGNIVGQVTVVPGKGFGSPSNAPRNLLPQILPAFFVSQLRLQQIANRSSIPDDIAAALLLILEALSEQPTQRTDTYPILFSCYNGAYRGHYLVYAYLDFFMESRTYTIDELLKLRDSFSRASLPRLKTNREVGTWDVFFLWCACGACAVYVYLFVYMVNWFCSRALIFVYVHMSIFGSSRCRGWSSIVCPPSAPSFLPVDRVVSSVHPKSRYFAVFSLVASRYFRRIVFFLTPSTLTSSHIRRFLFPPSSTFTALFLYCTLLSLHLTCMYVCLLKICRSLC